MARKARPAKAVKKIKEVVELVKVDAKDNIGTLKKVSQNGNGKLNGRAKANQNVDGKPVENATSEQRAAKQSTHVTSEKSRDVENSAGKTETEKPADNAKDTKTEGCPVSMVTGEELLQLSDVTLPGSLPFTFTRTYKTSGCEINQNLGYGWTHPLSQSLLFDGGKLFWKDAEGKRTELPEPNKSRPAIYNDLAGAAVFLGEKPNEYVLAQAGQPFHHFSRKGSTARLSAISDNYNNRLTLEYDGYDRPIAIINEHGIALWFVYQNGLISSIEFRTLKTDGANKEWITERTSFTYHYNDDNQLIDALNTAGEGEHYQYDTDNVISLRKMAGGVEFGWTWEGKGKAVRCIHHWSNTGYDTKFEWDDASNAVEVVYSDGSTSAYQHDDNAKLIERTDPDGAVTKNEFNENGDLVLSIDPLGNETRHVYNDFQQRVLTILPDEEVIEYQYWRGNLRRVIQGQRNWRYKYNANGDITEKRDPLGQDTFYRYNGQGQLSDITYPDGSKHKLAWNRLGMLIGETYPDGSKASYRYDIFGRIIVEKSAIGAVTQYEWDDADRLRKVILPSGQSKHFEYNGYGKATRVVDESGLETQYEYHPNTDLVSQVIQPDGSTLRYQYDNAKNFVTAIINERDETYHIDYFANGLVRNETTFDGRRFSYEYDLNGKLLKKIETGTEGTELETVFERDAMGRLTKKTLPDGNEVAYSYDQFGQLVSVDDGETPLAWRYDLLGRLTEEHQNWASNFFDYDSVGNLTHWQLPDANKLSYERSAGGVLNRVLLNDEQLTRHHYQNGLETARKQGDILSRFDHDEQGRLTAHTQHQNGRQTQSRKYQYGADGNLTEMADSRFGTVFYDYDPLSRLQKTRGVVEESFAHDPAGNLLDQVIGAEAGKKPFDVEGNQLKFHSDSHYEYDEFGRLITEKRGKDQRLVTGYEYDVQHRLIKASLPDGSFADYKYDAFGRRIEKKVTDKLGTEKTTEFVWQGDTLIAETSSEHYQTYVYEPGTFKPMAMLSGEGADCEVYHYHLDQIGTPTDITDNQGRSVWSVQYRAYGNVLRKHVEKISSPLRFQGQYFDEETGLHYNRHRYYSPNTGRFVTADPIGLAGGLNNYQYVPNPMGWVDPLGLAVTRCNGPCEQLTKKAFNQHVDNFSENVKSSNFQHWKKNAVSQGLSESDIQDIVHHGSLKKGENIWGDDWGRYLKEISGTEPPPGMNRPHAHHMVEKAGGKQAGQLNRMLLSEVGIDPLLSKHNLTWAPNVTGQHGYAPQLELSKKLIAVRGDRNGILNVLREQREVSASK
ncbi:RHS repeat-associated core domain-containing protein [Enterovibrio norvegicus]|uniref:RHS repeat-associated core domain-containing protein n=1 Tax=Enterovibrio norvegicus TaxID=188144 RepID=UPI003899BAC2